MSFYTQPNNRIIVDPVPEFTDIGFSGDGKAFLLEGNQGSDGITVVSSSGYDNSLSEVVDGQNYSKYFCDHLISNRVIIQGSDMKINGAYWRDFCAVEILYLFKSDPETWVLAKRYVKRFYLSTDTEDQDTPDLPYGKEVEPGKFILRTIYFKHQNNNQDVKLRLNYVLHEINS